MLHAIVSFMRTRAALVVLALGLTPLAAATFAGDAHASVSIAVTWDGLLRESTVAVVASALDSHAAWENGRIYSYTRVRVDRAVAGDMASGGEAWVRTMGGVVGNIGQIVEGEAVLMPGEQSLLFLRQGPAGCYEVTARGQGQFPVVVADRSAAKLPPFVVRSHSAGALVAPQLVVSTAAVHLAADMLHGRSVDEVATVIASDWSRMHARP
jgi:hypothetical protein